MGTTRLFSTASVREQWEDLAWPWLRELAGTAWKSSRPTVVLTPSRAESFYLRSRMVEAGAPYFGLRFWTPSDARKFLLAETSPEIEAATQAELRLVARVCAERLVTRANGDAPTLNSVIREPGAFLRAYDLLLSAGWDPAKEGAAYGRDLARAVQREMKKLGIDTQAGLHRRLFDRMTMQPEPLLANLLVIGFNAVHWPLWDLLKALTLAAERADVSLIKPKTFAENLDQLWMGSWEEFTGGETLSPSGILIDVPSGMESPFQPLVESYEQGVPANVGDAYLAFRITPDLATQVRAVTLQALLYLKRKDCTRLGVVFPEANALALGVAAELRRLGIPLDDGTGALTPGIFEQRCWRSWIALQEEAGVESLLAWLRACDAQGVSWGLQGRTARKVAEVIDATLGETLVDDLHFIASHLEAGTGRHDYRDVAKFLRERIALPDEATFERFLDLTRQAMTLTGWEQHLASLQSDPPGWLRKSEDILSRRTFLEWLKEATDSHVRTRGAEGNHFYGKVDLLVYGQMTGQAWSHLILTGLNEGVWPRVMEAGAFGSRHDLLELNTQAKALNKRVKTQGGQGEGHETVVPGKGYCLLPLERQDLALRDLCAALTATSHAVCLTALTTDGGRSLLPSDFLNHAYQAFTGELLDEETFRNAAKATEAWCRKHDSFFAADSKVVPAEIEPTRIAYNARRNDSSPFGSYEFSYASPPAEPIQLSCKDWEGAWKHPATAWLDHVVGASCWPEGSLSWPRAVGTWVHRWLAAALRDCRDRNSTTELAALIGAAADREAAAVRDRARLTGLSLYPWWDQVWMQARTFTFGLAENLPPALEGRDYLYEYWLPKDLTISLPGTSLSDFLLKGRIDLLLLDPRDSTREANDFSDRSGWVIDFKTGSAAKLTLKKVAKGTGLQTVLYALAVRELGASPTSISILTPGMEVKAQVTLENIVADTQLFRSFDKLHRDGIFGMRPDSENEYGFAPAYPLATRFIPEETLNAKWLLVHGNTGGDEEKDDDEDPT